MEHAEERLLRLPQVLEIIPISASTFYKGIREGVYPRPRKLGPRTSVWQHSQIMSIVSSTSNGEAA